MTYNSVLEQAYSAYSKLTSILDSTPNILQYVQQIINDEFESVSQVPDIDIVVKAEAGDIRDHMVSGQGTFPFKCVKLKAIAEAIMNANPDYDVQTQIPLLNEQGVQVDTMPLGDVIAAIAENRSWIEDSLSSLDAILQLGEAEITEYKAQLDLLLNKVTSTGLRNQISSWFTESFASLGAAVTPQTAGALFFDLIARLGITTPQNSHVNDCFDTYSGVSPWAIWFAGITSGVRSAIEKIPTFLSGLSNGFLKVLLAIGYGIAQGVVFLTKKAGNALVNFIGTQTNTADAIKETGSIGDQTILNTGVVWDIGLFHDGYEPTENGIFDATTIINQDFYMTYYTGGAKHTITYSVEADIPTFHHSIQPKLVNPYLVEQIAISTGLYSCLPVVPNWTGDHALTGLTRPSSPRSATVEMLQNFVNTIRTADTTWTGLENDLNIGFLTGIFYAKVIDFAELCLLKADVSRFGSYENWTAADFFNQFRDQALDLISPSEGMVLSNRDIISYACANLRISGNYAIIAGSWSDTAGPEHASNTGWRSAYAAYFSMLLGPVFYYVMYHENPLSLPDVWISYLTRPYKFKSTYYVLSDREMSKKAAGQLLAIIGAVAAVTAVVLSVKFLPKFLKWKSQTAMKLDYAAYAYGENPTEDNYKAYKKLKFKASLTGAATKYASDYVSNPPEIAFGADASPAEYGERILARIG